MVWGMREPSSFGDFFPDGEYVGWDEEMLAYYQNEMPDAEKAEMGMQERILYSKFSEKLSRDRGPLKPHECPKNFQTVKTYTNIGSLTLLGLLAVDEDLKNTIEKLEPGVHQFWPITITMPKGKVYPKQYYGLRIGQFIDSFSPEFSDAGSWRTGGLKNDIFRAASPPKKEHMSGLAMQASVFGNAHLWREKKLLDPHYYMSDALHDEIIRLELRTPPFFKLKAV